MKEYGKFKLKNGAKVILAPMKNTEIITTLLLLPFGSRFEKEKEQGIAHFIEHMLFKGTKNRPTALAISKELDRLGAEFNAFTAHERTGYYIKVLKENLKNALDILADIFFNSLFIDEEIEKEKGVILEEIRLYEDNPFLQIGQIFYQTLFANHPLGRNIAGKPEIIKTITREKIFSYQKNFYQPNNLLITLAGPVTKKDLVLVEKYFSKEGRGERREFKKFIANPHPPKIKIVNRSEIEQVQMILGFPGISLFSPDEEALDILSIALGGNMSSRLFQEIREKRGLAYSVGCSHSQFYETGAFSIGAGIDPKNVEETLKIIIEELNKIKKDGLTKKEIIQTKDYLIRRIKIVLEDSWMVANWYADQEIVGKKILTPEEKYKKIKRVTADEIKRIGQKIFNRNQINLALVGPIKDERRYLEILKKLL